MIGREPHFTLTRKWTFGSCITAALGLAALLVLSTSPLLEHVTAGLAAGCVMGGLEVAGRRLRPALFREAHTFSQAMKARWATLPGKASLGLLVLLCIAVFALLDADNVLRLLAAAAAFELTRSLIELAGTSRFEGTAPPN